MTIIVVVQPPNYLGNETYLLYLIRNLKVSSDKARARIITDKAQFLQKFLHGDNDVLGDYFFPILI